MHLQALVPRIGVAGNDELMRLAPKIDVKVFCLDAQPWRQQRFPAAADGISVVDAAGIVDEGVGYPGRGGRRGREGQGRLDLAIGQAAGGVEQGPGRERVADTAADGPEVSELRGDLGVEREARKIEDRVGEQDAAFDARPLDVGLDADDYRRYLQVAAELSAAERAVAVEIET